MRTRILKNNYSLSSSASAATDESLEEFGGEIKSRRKKKPKFDFKSALSTSEVSTSTIIEADIHRKYQEHQIRDKGFTRCTVLLLLPTRHHALSFVLKVTNMLTIESDKFLGFRSSPTRTSDQHMHLKIYFILLLLSVFE